MFVGYADDHAGDIHRFICVQTKEKYFLSRDAGWQNLFWTHYKMDNNKPRRQEVELFLDEEENVNLEGSDSENNKISGDGNNTTEQRRLGFDIDVIGAREEEMGRQEAKQKKTFHPEMNPWKEQI